MISRPMVGVGRRRRVGKNHGTDNTNGTSAGRVSADRADPVATRQRNRYWRFFWRGRITDLFGSAGSGNALTRMTAWLSAIFFASSFGLAVIADNRTTSEDELGFEVPVYEPVEREISDSDVPDIDYGSEGDIPFDDAPPSSGE